MRKYDKVSNKVKIVGFKKGSGRHMMVDYYLIHPKYGREYAFTLKYSKRTYDLVKGGASVKEVMTYKSPDRKVMSLADCIKRMIPYLMEEIDWLAA